MTCSAVDLNVKKSAVSAIRVIESRSKTLLQTLYFTGILFMKPIFSHTKPENVTAAIQVYKKPLWSVSLVVECLGSCSKYCMTTSIRRICLEHTHMLSSVECVSQATER